MDAHFIHLSDDLRLQAPPNSAAMSSGNQPNYSAMRLISDTQERVRVLSLGGEIDLHFARVFRTLLEQPTSVLPHAVVLDLSQVKFIDSSGIAVIIEHLRSATRRSKVFCIGGMSDAVKQVFEIIHLEKAMPVFETKEAALEALAQGKIKEPPEPLFAPAN